MEYAHWNVFSNHDRLPKAFPWTSIDDWRRIDFESTYQSLNRIKILKWFEHFFGKNLLARTDNSVMNHVQYWRSGVFAPSTNGFGLKLIEQMVMKAMKHPNTCMKFIILYAGYFRYEIKNLFWILKIKYLTMAYFVRTKPTSTDSKVPKQWAKWIKNIFICSEWHHGNNFLSSTRPSRNDKLKQFTSNGLPNRMSMEISHLFLSLMPGLWI